MCVCLRAWVCVCVGVCVCVIILASAATNNILLQGVMLAGERILNVTLVQKIFKGKVS